MYGLVHLSDLLYAKLSSRTRNNYKLQVIHMIMFHMYHKYLFENIFPKRYLVIGDYNE